MRPRLDASEKKAYGLVGHFNGVQQMMRYLNRSALTVLTIGTIAISLGSCKSRSKSTGSDVKDSANDQIDRTTQFAQYRYTNGVEEWIHDTTVFQSGRVRILKCKLDGNVILDRTCKDNVFLNAINPSELKTAIAVWQKARLKMISPTQYQPNAEIVNHGVPSVNSPGNGELHLEIPDQYSGSYITFAMSSFGSTQYVNPGLVSGGTKTDLGNQVQEKIMFVVQKAYVDHKDSVEEPSP